MSKLKNTSLIVYGGGICPQCCDCDEIDERLTNLESHVSAISKQITTIENKIVAIESFVYLTDVKEYWSLDSRLSSLGVGVIRTGHTFNLWGIGSLNHTQSLSNSNVYYLITSNQFENLKNYAGDTTIGSLWIETPDGTIYNFPIRFDSTGIYFRPTSSLPNLPVGTTFKFTQALILVEQEP